MMFPAFRGFSTFASSFQRRSAALPFGNIASRTFSSSSQIDSIRLRWTRLQQKTPTSLADHSSHVLPHENKLILATPSKLYIADLKSFVFDSDQALPISLKGLSLHLVDNIFYLFGLHTRFLKKSLVLARLSFDEKLKLSMLEEPHVPSHLFLQKYVAVNTTNRVHLLGETYNDEIHNNPCNIISFDFKLNQWIEPKPTGKPPPTRDRLAVTAIENLIYVLCEDSDGATYRIFVLDADKNEWRSMDVPKTDACPTVRSGASLTRCKDHLILFGGIALGAFRNDIFAFNLKTLKWENVKVEGEIPASRTKHHVTNLTEDKLLLIGGKNNASQNDMYTLEIL